MIKFTHTDHQNITRIRRLLRIKSKCDNSDNKIIALFGSWIEKRIKKIDEAYFKPRVIEICQKENILRISTSYERCRNYMMFQTLLQNRI